MFFFVKTKKGEITVSWLKQSITIVWELITLHFRCINLFTFLVVLNFVIYIDASMCAMTLMTRVLHVN